MPLLNYSADQHAEKEGEVKSQARSQSGKLESFPFLRLVVLQLGLCCSAAVSVDRNDDDGLKLHTSFPPVLLVSAAAELSRKSGRRQNLTRKSVQRTQ